MRAMVLENLARLTPESAPLVLRDLAVPEPGADEILVEVAACGICHTEIDEIEGRTAPPALPVVPGHQVVGRVAKLGIEVGAFQLGARVGVGWIHSACGRCGFCRSARENLCAAFKATGRDVDGGYAEYMTVPAAFACPIPDAIPDVAAAPLLCAGAIGYRSLRLAGLTDGGHLGLTGFGASGHLTLQLARHLYPSSEIYVFARREETRAFARELGAVWAGAGDTPAPVRLDAIIDTTPAWLPVVEALGNLAPGGRLVINAIRKEDTDRGALGRLDYAQHLWLEKEIKSVANVTRRDLQEFLEHAAHLHIEPEVETFALADANDGLLAIQNGRGRGAKVLVMR